MAEFKNELILQDAGGNSVSIDLRNALVLGSAPTTETKARAGMQAYVVSGGTITAEYVCTAVSGSTYTWVKREVSGGGSAEVTAESIKNALGYTPADDEDITKLSKEIADLGAVPDYVKTEADEVADKVLSTRNAYSFVFGAFSDSHTTGNDESSAGIQHAGMGMNEINNLTRLDLLANFGDVILDRFTDSYKNGFLHVRKSFADIINAVPYMQMQGNHDELSTDTTEQARQKYYAYIGANNVGTVTDYSNKFRNYGYRDFEDCKIRVIYLNTADVSEGDVTTDVKVSSEQLNWLNTVALNLNDPDWGIIVLSHHPLNWYGLDNLLNALDTYKGKGTGAELIAHFHGHLHNFRAEMLGTNGILTITIPNACFGRNNEYGTSESYSEEIHTLFGDVDGNGNQRKFDKTENSAEDTAFNVIVVDMDNKVIHCYNYGAGVDRTIAYGVGVVYYSITNNLINVSTNNSTSSVESGSAYTATLTVNAGYVLDGVTVTMGGVDITDVSVTDGKIQIDSVTGDVIITATATAESTEIINILDTIGYTDGSRCKTSSNALSTDNPAATAFGWYDCSTLKESDVIRIYIPGGLPSTAGNNAYAAHVDNAEGTAWTSDYFYKGYLSIYGNLFGSVEYADNIITLTGRFTGSSRTKFRMSVEGKGADCVMTLNQEIDV